MIQLNSKNISKLSTLFVVGCVGYAIVKHLLVAIILKSQGFSIGFTVIAMALTLILVWVVLGGLLQRKILTKYFTKLTATSAHPVRYFMLCATLLASLEEAITVTITNLAPLYGVNIGQAYITASTNYFDVIFLHSVIAFVPMFATLGFILNRYDISPFKALIMWGIVGVLAEVMTGGTQAFASAPSWIFIYGLMVYLPAYVFINAPRKKPSFLVYPIFIIVILLSAVTTVWIPKALNHPQIHFQPITTLLQ